MYLHFKKGCIYLGDIYPARDIKSPQQGILMFNRLLKRANEESKTYFSRLKVAFARIEVKTAVKVGVAATISWFLGTGISKLMVRPDTLVSGVWCVVTAIVVLQANLGGTYKAAWLRFLGVLIGSVLGCAFTSWLGADPLHLGISVMITVLICTFLDLKDSVRIACLSVAVIMILWGIKPDINPWVFGFYRFVDSCLGIGVAMLVAHTLWPAQARNKLQSNIAKSFGLLSKLFRIAINLESTPEQSSSKSSDLLENEVSDLIKDSKSFLDEAKLELLARASTLDDWKILLNILEDILESVMTLNDLSKNKLTLILDDQLDKNLGNVVEQSDLIFQELVKSLDSDKSLLTESAKENLIQAVRFLKADLLRFRGTKTTRKFDMVDVESFFVFFYSLGNITENLLKAEEVIPKALWKE